MKAFSVVKVYKTQFLRTQWIKNTHPMIYTIIWLTYIKIFPLPPRSHTVIGCMHMQQSSKKTLQAFAAKHLASNV